MKFYYPLLGHTCIFNQITNKYFLFIGVVGSSQEEKYWNLVRYRYYLVWFCKQSAPTVIEEPKNVEQVLGTWRGHAKGVWQILKGNKKSSASSSLLRPILPEANSPNSIIPSSNLRGLAAIPVFEPIILPTKLAIESTLPTDNASVWPMTQSLWTSLSESCIRIWDATTSTSSWLSHDVSSTDTNSI